MVVLNVILNKDLGLWTKQSIKVIVIYFLSLSKSYLMYLLSVLATEYMSVMDLHPDLSWFLFVFVNVL